METLALSQELQHDDAHGAHADRDVGDVERGPVVSGEVKVEKVDDVAEKNPVDDVSDGSGKNGREAGGKPELAAVLIEHLQDHRTDDERKAHEEVELPAARFSQKGEGGARVDDVAEVEERRDLNRGPVGNRLLDKRLRELIKPDQNESENQKRGKART